MGKVKNGHLDDSVKFWEVWQDDEKKTNLELMLSELISWKMVAIIENKPTLLQSHFVGQDDVGCFKNMA